MRKASWLILASFGLTVGCGTPGGISGPIAGPTGAPSLPADGAEAPAVASDLGKGATKGSDAPSAETAAVGSKPDATAVVQEFEIPPPDDLREAAAGWPTAAVKLKIPRDKARGRSIQYVSGGLREVVSSVDGREYGRQVVPEEATEITLKLKVAPGKRQLRFDVYGAAQKAKRLSTASGEAVIDLGAANVIPMKGRGIVDKLDLSWGAEEPPVLVTGTPATFKIVVKPFDAAEFLIDKDPFLSGINLSSDAPADAIQLSTSSILAGAEDGVEVEVRYTGKPVSSFNLVASSTSDGGAVTRRLEGPGSMGKITATAARFDFLELGASGSVRIEQQGFSGDFEYSVEPEGLVSIEEGPSHGTFVIEASEAGTGSIVFTGGGGQVFEIPVTVTTVEIILD